MFFVYVYYTAVGPNSNLVRLHIRAHIQGPISRTDIPLLPIDALIIHIDSVIVTVKGVSVAEMGNHYMYQNACMC